MTTRFCSHCGKQHPEDEMRQVATKSGRKWRCIMSIEAAKKTAAERDAFGRKISTANSEARSATQRMLSSKTPAP